jgi:transposase-like protein
MERTHASEPVVAPVVCPACGSDDLVAARKTADESAYWRCRGCGEVWNVGRRQTTAPSPYDRSRYRR